MAYYIYIYYITQCEKETSSKVSYLKTKLVYYKGCKKELNFYTTSANITAEFEAQEKGYNKYVLVFF